MNNKILISLFCSILLIFVIQGINIVYKINYIFQNISINEIEKNKDFNKLFIELNNFENFLYYTGGLMVAILLPVFINNEKQKTKDQLIENLKKIKKRAISEKLI
jgi:hypothetical protein